MNLIDRETVLNRLDGDEELLQELLGIFLEYTPSHCQEMCLAVRQNDFASLRRAAHALKGSIGYLGAKPVVNALQQLDQLAQAADTRYLPEAWVEFDRQFEELTSAVAALLKGN